MSSLLKYTDDDDRCYGLTGMAIGLVVYDGQEMLAAIHLDPNDGDEYFEYTPAFYFSGNPGLPAKWAWKNLLEHYRLSTAMSVSNLLCRAYVKRHVALTPADAHALLEAARADGEQACQLEADEVDEMFSDVLNTMHRVFQHQGVQRIATSLAHELTSRRHMIASEVFELLAPLRRL